MKIILLILLIITLIIILVRGYFLAKEIEGEGKKEKGGGK